MAPRMYSWNLSPFAGKARIALRARNVDVDLVEINPADRPPELRELNPTNRVPVLVLEDGTVIRESTAIAEWAEETGSGASLWGADPGGRAAARGMLRWVDDELLVNYFLSMRKQAFGKDKGDPDDIVDILRRRLVKRWDTLEGLLGRHEGPWLMGGDAPTLADLAGLPLAVRIPAWTPDLMPQGERALAWFATLQERPEVEEVDRKGV